MNKFILTTDTSCDVFRHVLKENDIAYCPLTYTINHKEYKDEFDCDEQYQDFYKLIKNGAMPTTSQINIFEHEEFFESQIKQKPEGDILHLTLSSGLSNTYNNAAIAASTIMQKHPGRRIFILDTLGATQSHRCVLDQAQKLRDENWDVDKAYDFLVDFAKTITVWFVADDLMHLKRGGRVSGVAAYIGTMLSIKPILIINKVGGLSVITKIKSMAKSLSNILERMESCIIDTPHTVYLASADNHESCQKMKDMILQRFPYVNVEIGWIGPIIGSHTGSGAVGVVFQSKNERIA